MARGVNTRRVNEIYSDAWSFRPRALEINDENLSAAARAHESALWTVLRRSYRLARVGRAPALHHRQEPFHLGTDPRLSAGASQRGTGAVRCGHLLRPGAS